VSPSIPFSPRRPLPILVLIICSIFVVAPKRVSSTPLFAAGLSFDVGGFPYSVAIGDFNSDGKPDVVTSNDLSDDVSVLLGSGDGTFRAGVSYGTGPFPYAVAVGDVNGDGRLDIVTANQSTVSILLGNGDGTFQPRVDYSVGSYPFSVAIGDISGDGKA
jgi:hypothetical protein